MSKEILTFEDIEIEKKKKFISKTSAFLKRCSKNLSKPDKSLHGLNSPD